MKHDRTASWALLVYTAGIGLLGCSSEVTRRLDPAVVAMSDRLAPVYDDGELTIYEAKTGLMLPIIAPRPDQAAALEGQAIDPFERRPWVTDADLQIEVTWTLSNLDPQAHEVWVMFDPWNEFGRYEPAIEINGDEAVRDLSGIDMLFLLPGVEGADGVAPDPRLVGTVTFDDMDELALDFATVFKIIRDAVPIDATEDDPRSTLVNNAFNVRNRSYNSPLLAAYHPGVVPALVGFDFGVRTSEPANVALEILVEMRDRQGDRVAERGQSVRLLDAPTTVVSVGAP